METIEETTEQNRDKLTTLRHSTPLSRWIGEQVTILAEIFGESMTPARLKAYVANLIDLESGELKTAFVRARHELRFFPKIAELRELAGAGRKQTDDAEGRKAWDELTQFVGKYVSNDVHGNYGPQYGSYKNYPRLSDRLLDTVRRTGGWKLYRCMTEEDFPFVQKRFFEEYAAWTAVARIRPERMLADDDSVAAKFKQLTTSKAMP